MRARVASLVLGATAALGIAAFALYRAVGPSASAERQPGEVSFERDGEAVTVGFQGEIAHGELFVGDEELPTPRAEDGEPEIEPGDPEPTWLSFAYEVGDEAREVLVAKRPIGNHVSWDAIARAGAALGDGAPLAMGGAAYRQDAVVSLADGHDYRVRLPICGQGTLAGLSEWNLLIGGVHEGDRDFAGPGYAWIDEPYRDEELLVGYEGSLSWCRDRWARGDGERVVRGYFLVSRFHATPPHFSGDRLYWRPVLERVSAERPAAGPELAGAAETLRPEVSADRRVRYFGAIPHEALFEDGAGLAERLELEAGQELGGGTAPWLKFHYDGDTLLVAARPLRRSLSWDDIAEVGAARLGDEETAVGGEAHRQDAAVRDDLGNRYRVRLLRCGDRTMDRRAEWNRLIGGVHRGDGDFAGRPGGVYGWVSSPLSDEALGTVAGHGAASWCYESEDRDGERWAVNRGYLTVARYHVTESDFPGSGFGWRPVLELAAED